MRPASSQPQPQQRTVRFTDSSAASTVSDTTRRRPATAASAPQQPQTQPREEIPRRANATSVSPASTSSSISPESAAAASASASAAAAAAAVADDYILRDLTATIAEQRRHLDIARMGLEKERSARTQLTATVQRLEADNAKLRTENDARKDHERNLRELCEELRAQVAHLRGAVQAQQEQTAEVTQQRDTERQALAELRAAYSRLKDEFDANERVFQELLGALREMEKRHHQHLRDVAAADDESAVKTKTSGSQLAQRSKSAGGSSAAATIAAAVPTGRVRPNVVVEFADDGVGQRQPDSSSVHSVRNTTSAPTPTTLGNAVWLTAWRQLKQRRHFEQTADQK